MFPNFESPLHITVKEAHCPLSEGLLAALLISNLAPHAPIFCLVQLIGFYVVLALEFLTLIL